MAYCDCDGNRDNNKRIEYEYTNVAKQNAQGFATNMGKHGLTRDSFDHAKKPSLAGTRASPWHELPRAHVVRGELVQDLALAEARRDGTDPALPGVSHGQKLARPPEPVTPANRRSRRSR